MAKQEEMATQDGTAERKHRDPIACTVLVFKNRLLRLANFLGGKMGPFS